MRSTRAVAGLGAVALTYIVGAAAASATSSLPADAVAAIPARTTPDFCLRVQELLTSPTVTAENVVQPDYEAFRKSKTTIDPLTIHQFVQRDDSGRPKLVSCKTKTADHLISEYGDNAADRDNGLDCRDVNRAIVMAAWSSLTAADRAAAIDRPDNTLLDGDTRVMTGGSWVKPFDAIYRAADGRLHLHAKSLRVEWDNPVWALMPDSLRGVQYCHLVAPEFVRAVMLGEARVESPR